MLLVGRAAALALFLYNSFHFSFFCVCLAIYALFPLKDDIFTYIVKSLLCAGWSFRIFAFFTIEFSVFHIKKSLCLF
jgi:hypothetical protein